MQYFYCASACAAEPSRYELAKLEKLDGPSFRPADKEYPAELAAAGVQGEVLVIVPLTTDGRSDGAILGASSRSTELDRIALELTRAAKFQVKEGPTKGWKVVVVSVEFYKDSVGTVKQKSCADFNADYAYQLATFPDRKVGEMRIFNMLTGIMYIGGGANVSHAAELANRSAAARQPTIDACKANPDGVLFETWQSSLKSAF